MLQILRLQIRTSRHEIAATVRCFGSQQRRQISRSSVLYRSSDTEVLKIPKSDDADGDVNENASHGLLRNFAAHQQARDQVFSSRSEHLQAREEELRRLKANKDGEQEPQRLARARSSHHDLQSYLEHCSVNNVNTSSTVYKGTLYEYTVADSLRRFGIDLERRGQAGDLGIDLFGFWKLPSTTSSGLRWQRLFIQCKLSKPMPALIRELEGTYAGAPAGWRGATTLALLASSYEASSGANLALSRSDLPLGFVQVSKDGQVKQFVWNQAAKNNCLPGVGVTSRYDAVQDKKKRRAVDATIELTWNNQPWPVSKS